MVGRTLTHHRVLETLGAGGMGEVYLAEDLSLRRRVALKVLPPELADDETRRARFSREARALAALNHPNIVTVYSVEQDDGIHFITMEFVKGKTLADVLPADGLPLDRFFEIAIPLADAVAAAHQHGIVHRDLKPANVMVTDEGAVKVLDFGLAKAHGGIDATMGATEDSTFATTGPGIVVGTLKYMSPEQARGDPVDARSDLFALGVVFYEMLTGRRPFSGGASGDVIASLLKDDPPPVSSLRTGVPRELSKVVHRCLSKTPSHRMQSALDVRIELEEVKRDIDSGELTRQPQPASAAAVRSRTVFRSTAAGVATVGLLLLAWLLTKPPEARLHLQSARQVTFAAGEEIQPTWSPDGGRIAYAAGGHIWVAHAAGGPVANLTRDVPGPNGDPAWSPDGGQIAFVSQGGVYVMPAIGGAATRVSPTTGPLGVAAPQWSADGSELAYLRGSAGQAAGNFIEIVSPRSRESRQIRIPGDAGNRFDLSWSPNGRFFAYVRAPNRDDGISRMWVLPASGEREIAVTDGQWNDWSPTWSNDSRSLVFVSNRGGTMDVWQQRVTESGQPEGAPIQVSVGVGVRQAALSRDGRKLAYSQGRPVANVWRVPLLQTGESGWDVAEQLTFDQAFIQGIDIFPGGERLVFSSDRGGTPDLWVLDLRGTNITRLTEDPSADQNPHVSPDGAHVGFYSYRSGNRDIWIVPSEGGAAKQVTSDPGVEMGPSWSPDSQAIAFWSDRDGGNSDVFVLPLAGGGPRKILEGPNYFPQWSPDGRWIGAMNGGRFTRVPASGGAPEVLTTEPMGQPFRWSADGTGIYFKRDRELWLLTLATSVERRLTSLSSRAGAFGPYALAVTPTHLYFTWRQDLGDIWVMDAVPSDR